MKIVERLARFEEALHQMLIVCTMCRSFTAAAIVTLFPGLMLAQTSMEEYKYISRGIKASAEFGLDLKQGYELGTMREWYTPLVPGGDAKRYTRVAALYRFATKTPAGLLMVLKRTDTDFLKTICIPMPSSSSEVMNLAVQDFSIATSEWSEQARTYCWHLALMLAQEVEESAQIIAATPRHLVDQQMQECLAKVDYERDGSDFIHPDYVCLQTALDAWVKELELKQGLLLQALTGDDRNKMASFFGSWETTMSNIQGESALDSFGGSMFDGEIIRSEIEFVKARINLIETYLGILETGR